jgi:hypothetical protein
MKVDPEEFVPYSNRPAKKPVKYYKVKIVVKALVFGLLFLLGFILLNKIFFPAQL